MAVVPVTTDAYVDQARASANFGGAIDLSLDGGAGATNKEIFLYVKPPPKGTSVISAIIKVRIKGAWAGTNSLTLKKVEGKWAENKVTWSNKPASVTTDQATAVVTTGVDKQVVSFDITAMMQAISAGAKYTGLTLIITEDVTRKIYSTEEKKTALRPTLEMIWTDAPLPPYGLSPSGGQAVSLASPILKWLFRDKTGNTNQTSSQVQISTASDFAAASIVYDSGKLANTVNQWDLAATAFGGFTIGTTYYWRVQVWDGSDLVSGYSDVAQLTRTAKGTLTITLPAAPAANQVDETGPVFAWTFSGTTQEAIEVVVFSVPTVGDPVEIYRFDRTVQTALLHEMSPILQLSTTYRLRLRVYDTISRANLPGDPDYVEATRDFTYQQTGGPTAVAAFTATKDEASILFSWTRATAPNYFCLVEDGIKIQQRLDPTTLFISGTTYNYRHFPTPRVSHTYSVESVVDTATILKHSNSNPSATVTTTPTGIWLVDKDDNKRVQILDDDEGSISIPESGTTFELINKKAPVRIVDGTRGYVGSVSGLLGDRTSRDDFLTLRSRLKELYLVIGDLAIPVRLEGGDAAPRPHPSDATWTVGFTFFQVGPPWPVAMPGVA